MDTLTDAVARPKVAALHIADESFFVASTIERCPKTMMLRELVTNAIEAASGAGADRRVEIGSRAIDGVRKLAIWNTGRGLSAAELDRISDLASSLHKVHSLDANFGMGAKVAALPSNRHGLRYRSCKDGVVSEVILGQRDGVYGRLARGWDVLGAVTAVIDVTDLCRDDPDHALDHDWTEVVLFGNRADQDTLADPYNGNPHSAPDWIGNALEQRYFDLPQVALTLHPAAGLPRRFVPLAARMSRYSRNETVAADDGVMIHYLFADEAEAAGCAMLAFRDELYGLRQGAQWALDAPSYGIAFGAARVTIVVELPAHFPVRPEAYRQFLRFRDGDQRQVGTDHFARQVRERIPAWLADIIRALGPQPLDYMSDVYDELQALLAELGVAPGVGPQFRHPAMPAAPPPSLHFSETPAAPPTAAVARPPEVIALSDAAQIAERGLNGRVAKFYPDSYQLFVNLGYPAIQTLARRLQAHFAPSPRVLPLARNVAEWAITRKVARTLVHGLSKLQAGWSGEEVARAHAPESLSVAADDVADQEWVAARRLGEMIGRE